MANNERRFLGLDQPFTNSKFGSFKPTTTSDERIKSNLTHLLLTNRGERIGHPTFGCDVYKTLFENIDNIETPFESLKERIMEQVNFWMPYIVVDGVNISVDDYDENTIHLSVTYITYGNKSDVLDINILVQ